MFDEYFKSVRYYQYHLFSYSVLKEVSLLDNDYDYERAGCGEESSALVSSYLLSFSSQTNWFPLAGVYQWTERIQNIKIHQTAIYFFVASSIVNNLNSVVRCN